MYHDIVCSIWKMRGVGFRVCRIASRKMENKPNLTPDPRLRLMDQILRYPHCACRTEQAYCNWIFGFVRFHGGQSHSNKMGRIEVEAFLSHPATHGQVSTATQKQAFNAIVSLSPSPRPNAVDLSFPRAVLSFRAKRVISG
ncbi:MAG TPA: hypothetical protein DCZ69_08605 [Syntrophobacteraceae bacterium]|nr:hypothetical protein [Syntrophobacteraceae bacterium]